MSFSGLLAYIICLETRNVIRLLTIEFFYCFLCCRCVLKANQQVAAFIEVGLVERDEQAIWVCFICFQVIIEYQIIVANRFELSHGGVVHLLHIYFDFASWHFAAIIARAKVHETMDATAYHILQFSSGDYILASRVFVESSAVKGNHSL